MASALAARSGLKRIRVTFTGLVSNDLGVVTEVELGTAIATPKEFSTGSHGFYAGGKLHDLSCVGMENGVKYDIGCNIVGLASRNWEEAKKVNAVVVIATALPCLT